MNSQMQKWQGLEGSQVQWLLSAWSCGDTLPAFIVLASSEAL